MKQLNQNSKQKKKNNKSQAVDNLRQTSETNEL